VEAARALAAIRPTGLEHDAGALAADATPHGKTRRLTAAWLLRRHQGDEAVRLLQALGRDPEPTVAAVALARLVEIDAKLVVPLLEPVLASPDANVRGLGVEALFRQPTLAHIRLLGDRLADPHPEVRTRARAVLHELAGRAEFRGPVVRAATDVLAEDDWRGQEQAAVLLAQLGHKPAAGRLVELLGVDRPETMLAVGWALRKLAVPDTLPAVLAFIDRDRKATLATVRAGSFSLPPGRDQEVAQLVEFLAQARYRPAEPLFREMVPRILPRVPTSVATPPGPNARAAAVWGLGLLHEGTAVPDLVTAFQARLNDVPSPAGSEDDRVRRAAAISLGRMKATAAVPTLRRYYAGKPTLDPVNNACGWALERITGEPVPPAGVIERVDRGWFLSPVN
jgi:HEAT repeat protein